VAVEVNAKSSFIFGLVSVLLVRVSVPVKVANVLVALGNVITDEPEPAIVTSPVTSRLAVSFINGIFFRVGIVVYLKIKLG
jgi:hypothetical protein